MKKVYLLVLSLLIVGLTSPILVSADNRVRPTYKFSEEYNTIFTLWGHNGNSYYAVRDNQLFTGAGTFAVECIMIAWGNITVEVEVYSFYEETVETVPVYDENGTQTGYTEQVMVNATLLESNAFKGETTFTQRWIEIPVTIGEHPEEVFVRVSVGSEYFFFKFQWQWDFIETIMNNAAWFWQSIVDNLVPVVIAFVVAVAIAKRFLSKAYSIPPFNESPLMPMMVYGLAAGIVLLGFWVRPPSFYLIAIGIVTGFFMFVISMWAEPTTYICLHDQVTGKNHLIDIIRKEGSIKYIRSSWWDVLLRLCGKDLVLPIEEFMLPETGDFEYLVQGKNIRLPNYEFSLTDKPLYRLGLAGFVVVGIIMIFWLFAQSGNPFVLWGLTVIPIVLVIYLLAFKKFELKAFQMEFYPKTAQKYFAKAIAEKLSQETVKLELKEVTEEFTKVTTEIMAQVNKEPLLYQFPQKRSVKALLRKIPVIRRLVHLQPDTRLEKLIALREQLAQDFQQIEEIFSTTAEKFRFLHEQKHDLPRELRSLEQAGLEIEQKEAEIERLNDKVLLKGADWVEKKVDRWDRQLRGDFKKDKELDSLFEQKKTTVTKKEVQEAVSA